MQRTVFRHVLMALIMLACVGLTTTPAVAGEVANEQADSPPATAMALDFFLLRPLGLLSTVAGTGIFVVSMPFSLLGGNVEEAAHTLVYKPGAYTFSRPLGEFDQELD